MPFKIGSTSFITDIRYTTFKSKGASTEDLSNIQLEYLIYDAESRDIICISVSVTLGFGFNKGAS